MADITPWELDLSVALSLLAVVVLIGANAFFVAQEFSLVAVDRSKVAVMAERGERPWKLVQKLLSELSFHLSAAQVGITISSLIFGFLAAPVGRQLLSPIIGLVVSDTTSIWLTVVIAFAMANMLQVVLGEVVPKTLAIAEPIPVLRVCARGIAIWGFLVRPIVKIINNMADALVAKMGMEPAEELSGVKSLGELEHVIRASGAEGMLDPEDVTRLTRTIRFAEKTAGDILVPRVDLVTIASGASLADLARLSEQSGHSRFPVVGDGSDDVRGLVHAKRVLAYSPKQRESVHVGAVMREAYVVPESRELDSLLDEMYRQAHHLAFVLDEHGGLAGIVTLEDIVEEIVGEIGDEHDLGEQVHVQPQLGGEQGFFVSGSLHPDELEEATGIEIPEGSYETVAGFVLDQLQKVPDEGDCFTFESWRFCVAEMDNWRVAKIAIETSNPVAITTTATEQPASASASEEAK